MSRQPIEMPALSDTMETGRLVSWLKKPGDPVKKGEAIAEVESDKAIMELEAFADGYLAGPLAEPDSEVPVGTVIGYISSEPPGTEEAASPQAERPAQASPPPPATGRAQEEPAVAHEPALPPRPARRSRPTAHQTPVGEASPYARALAADLELDLSQVAPGPDGRLHAAQVVAAALAGPEPELSAGPAYRLEPLTPMQRAVAAGMEAAARTPAFRVSARLPLDKLHQAAHEQGHSLTLLLGRACARAIERHPRFNAVYTRRGLALREQVDLGIAVDLPDGLVTPVLRNVGGRTLAELAEDWTTLKEKATSRRLTQDEYTGATFYLSNLGVFPRVTRFDAIVPRDASAILAVGAAHEGAAEFTLSCDHRVVYGADAARFLETLGEFLDDPVSLLD